MMHKTANQKITKHGVAHIFCKKRVQFRDWSDEGQDEWNVKYLTVTCLWSMRDKQILSN